jgi:hypothetical protein
VCQLNGYVSATKILPGVDPAVPISEANSTAKLFGCAYGAELLKTA